MNNVTQIVQKVHQAPWRVQRQWVVVFLLGLVIVAMVAGVYLNITVRATLAGREIQTLLNPSLINPAPNLQSNSIATNQRINSELQMQLADLTSVVSMRKRAEVLGFQSANPDEMIFVAVPGYVEPPSVDLSTSGSDHVLAPVILPEYSESWFDYFLNQQTSSAATGGQP